MLTAERAVQEAAPVLEQIECTCGQVMLDNRCLNPECEVAASQSVPTGSLQPNGIAMPSAFTIRGSVD